MKASEVSFGVEIECNIPNEYQDSFPTGGYHSGVQSPVFPAGWNTQSDSSVHSSSGFYSAEIVSPPLKGEDGLTQIVYVLDLLDQIGARTNKTCGLHVHFGIDGLNSQQVDRLVKIFKYFELSFFALNGEQFGERYYGIPGRNHYCKPSCMWQGQYDRYQSLNWQHRHEGHLEIRVWHGTIKAEMVLAAIYMATSLVSKVSKDEKIKVSDMAGQKPSYIMAKFIQRILKADDLIVEDFDPGDLFKEMMVEAVKANGMTR